MNVSDLIQGRDSDHHQPMELSVPPPLDLTPYLFNKDEQYIAGGGFGDVYRCWCQVAGSHKQVAVKAFRFKFACDEDGNARRAKMLRRELGIWRRLHHDNVVPFLGVAYGFGMRGAMSLVSLWMPNDSLHHFLETYSANLAIGHRLRFLLDVANGLQYLHSFPIIHGDLNCNNVLVDENCTARLTDFGYASLIGNIPEVLSYLQRSTARPGALRWIAPEQVESEETFNRTTKSDILSGKQPWSEVPHEAGVIIRLTKGHTPGRPASEMLLDSHWDFIQTCWSQIEARPTSEDIVLSVRQLLDHSPPPWLLQDVEPFLSARRPGALAHKRNGEERELSEDDQVYREQHPRKAAKVENPVLQVFRSQPKPTSIPSPHLDRDTLPLYFSYEGTRLRLKPPMKPPNTEFDPVSSANHRPLFPVMTPPGEHPHQYAPNEALPLVSAPMPANSPLLAWQPPLFASSPATSASRPSDTQRHVKRKRSKAHTATSKSFSIPTVPRDKRNRPLLPLNVGIMTVVNLGEVCMREHFHTERYIFPVGYEVTRRYHSTVDPYTDAVYHCSILDGGDGPKFQVVASDVPDRPMVAGTSTGVWSSIVKHANTIRNRQHSNSVSDPDFYGLGQNTIKYLIQELPNADRLRDYVWQHIVESGPPNGSHAAVIPALSVDHNTSANNSFFNDTTTTPYSHLLPPLGQSQWFSSFDPPPLISADTLTTHEYRPPPVRDSDLKRQNSVSNTNASHLQSHPSSHSASPPHLMSESPPFIGTSYPTVSSAAFAPYMDALLPRPPGREEAQSRPESREELARR